MFLIKKKKNEKKSTTTVTLHITFMTISLFAPTYFKQKKKYISFSIGIDYIS